MKAFPKESLRRICFAIARLSYIYRSSVKDKLWRPAHYQMFASAVALVNKPYESGNSYMMPIVQWHSGVLDETSDGAHANDEEDIQNVELPPAVLSRRDALVPEDRKLLILISSSMAINVSFSALHCWHFQRCPRLYCAAEGEMNNLKSVVSFLTSAAVYANTVICNFLLL
ncbi:N-acetylgalactosamine kinase [Trichinella spiralis]|uniref:N-acetylgalactosamine kinase n=1 Tax=Trichinella spiralis TaxID=6334 RepID=UPI0001EFD749|nr:N-acetylgalactosamine kinase [Trichinella spiralis]